MTDNTEALITEGSDYATRRFGTVPGHLVHRLTDALRTMTVSRGNVLLLNTHITNALNAAEAERDRYRAAIDEIRTTLPRPLSEPLSRDFSGRPFPRTIDGDKVADILTRALKETT